ncbi:hypothetical protein ACHAWF_015331 [Thalassiosira exigua]
MIRMKRVFGLLIASAQLICCGATALENQGHDDGDDPPEVEEHVETIDHDQLLFEPDELAATQAILDDFQFTRTLRDALKSPRRLSGTCLPKGAPCSDHTSNCCQGGCNSNNVCYSQPTGGFCFKYGREDFFCSSNRCGSNGRCECIKSGQSCAVGPEFCCSGMICSSNKRCVFPSTSGGGDGTSGKMFVLPPRPRPPTNRPTKRPTRNPTQRPTRNPTRRPTPSAIGSKNNCQQNSGFCFKKGSADPFCCSNFCGDDNRCTASLVTTPQYEPSIYAKGGKCGDPTKIKITVEVNTDQYGSDTSWSLTRESTRRVISSVKNGTYGVLTKYKRSFCVAPGKYEFFLSDRYGDGFCCEYGDGNVRLYLDDREVAHMTYMAYNTTAMINAGFDPNPYMSLRELQYLHEHNKRRKEWHLRDNKEYVPLVYSPAMARESRRWAEELLGNCSINGIEHEPKVREGENLAKNVGTVDADGRGWGQLYDPSRIVGRWVEWEVNWDYPDNAHLTQALWRPAKYLGCGEAAKKFRGGMCRVQVCRYARAGNCEMARFDAKVGDNWLKPVLQESSRCGPHCPSGGCI